MVTAILWNGERGELEDLKARESSPAQREFSANRANLFGGLALGLGAAAIATAGVTLVFTLKAPAKSAVGGLPPQRTVRASVGAGALRVHGTF